MAPLLQKSAELGFCVCGVASPFVAADDVERFRNWLANGYNAGMEWMQNHDDLRLSPQQLVSGTQSVVMVALPYFTPYSPLMQRFHIARFARGLDYHGLIREKLRRLLAHMNAIYGPVSGRAFSDSAPILEHALATRAGLGWLGKNGLLYVKGYGSYVLLGALFVDILLEPHPVALPGRCGSCTACIEACPTGALCAPHTLDARRCLSYLTIEHKGSFVSPGTRLYGRLFGCDICQEVCPWNRKVNATTEPAFLNAPEFIRMTDDALWNLSEEEFGILFKGTPVLRVGYAGWRRNLEAIGQEERG